MVVEPTSIATPKARSAKPGMIDDDVAALAQCDGDLPLSRAQRLLQIGERRKVGGRVARGPIARAKPVADASDRSTARACPARRPRRNRGARPDRSRSDASSARLRIDLPVDLAFGRHIDDEIAANPGLAAEPPAWRKRSALRGIAGLDLSPRRHMIGARMNCVLGEIAFGDVDLTAAADASPAADRIEIDAERPRGFEQAYAFGELAPLAGRREDDAMGAQRCTGSGASAPIAAERSGQGGPSRPSCLASTARRCVSYSFSSRSAAA